MSLTAFVDLEYLSLKILVGLISECLEGNSALQWSTTRCKWWSRTEQNRAGWGKKTFG